MSHNIDKLLTLANQFEQVATDETLVSEAKDTKKPDPKAAVRNRGKCVFPAESPKVKDDKDHYPIGTIDQARTALRYVAKQESAPWYKGTVKELKDAVRRKVKQEYPSIDVSEPK